MEKPRNWALRSLGAGGTHSENANGLSLAGTGTDADFLRVRPLHINIMAAIALLVLALCIAEALRLVALGGAEWPLLAGLSLALVILALASHVQGGAQAETASQRQDASETGATGEPAPDIAELEEQIEQLKCAHKELACRYRQERHNARMAHHSKSVFLSHLSHDIRTPLNHIIGFSDLISHQTFGPLGDERYLDYVQDIKKSGEGLLRSVADILELAELESGQRIVTVKEILIDDMFNSLRNRFSARAKRCDIDLRFEYDSEHRITGDRMGLQRVLENILDNALRFTPRQGKVTLAAWQGSDGAVFEITDTGIGIPAERLDQLFTPFSLEDAMVRKDGAGMCLGLAIARAITELNGGEIAIDSQPSIGTTVAVSLPSQPPRDAQHQPVGNAA